MKLAKVLALLFFAAALVLPFAASNSVEGQAATEAPTTQMDARNQGDLWNGMGLRTRGAGPIDECTNPPQAGASFEDNKFIFEEREVVDDGLGPVYNDISCAACHQAPVTGHTSQINELRHGVIGTGGFTPPPGGQTLIQDRAIDPRIQEFLTTAAVGQNLFEFRATRTILGDGFIEAISNTSLQNNVNAQPAAQRGMLRTVGILEAPGQTRFGRFGWKSQHASLESFSADAYVNEMGITSPLQPNENNSVGRSVAAFDRVTDPEDDGDDVEAFRDFMRATSAPGRGPINADVNAGSALFDSVGCAVCHTRTFTTVAAGTSIAGGTFIVPAALGNKIIHPFSDFAVHNIGTSVQIGGEAGLENNQFAVTTPVLWGVRAKHRFGMQGQAHTIFDMIQAHSIQATDARNRFNALNNTQKAQLIAFVTSL